MAKGKYQKWLEPDGLTLLEAWARDGLSIDEIAIKCGIVRSTLHEWMNKYPDISDALKKGREIVDVEVENALFKKALGYNAEIRKTFKVRTVEYDPDTGRKISEHEELQTSIDEVHIPADTTAQIFWLKNRRPDQWRDRQELIHSNAMPVTIIDDVGAEMTKEPENADS